jgi:formate dehydrogenase maturation protein FdhE
MKKKTVIAQGFCPKCGGSLNYGGMEVEGEGLYYECSCSLCEFTGQEWYDARFAGFHDDEDTMGELIEPAGQPA